MGGAVDDFPAGDVWHFQREILLADELDRVFTIEPGIWREIIGFDRLGERIAHADYAADGGATIRFGDGTFGQRPPDDTVFRVTYRSGPGRRANLPADSIILLVAPPEAPAGAEAPAVARLSPAATRSPVTGGRDPQDMELARRIMPEAFRALVWRAVLDRTTRRSPSACPGCSAPARSAAGPEAGSPPSSPPTRRQHHTVPRPPDGARAAHGQRAAGRARGACRRPGLCRHRFGDRDLRRARHLFRPGPGARDPGAYGSGALRRAAAVLPPGQFHLRRSAVSRRDRGGGRCRAGRARGRRDRTPPAGPDRFRAVYGNPHRGRQ